MIPVDFNHLSGLCITTSQFMADTVRKQIRFPRSKKRRIRKKWAKRPENWTAYSVPWATVYRMDDLLVMHPAILGRVTREIEDRLIRSMQISASMLDGDPSYSSYRAAH